MRKDVRQRSLDHGLQHSLTGADALTENDVIAHVCAWLEAGGYVIEQRLRTTQSGDDIIAMRSDGSVRLFIEAKGATSARAGSARYGTAFDQSQASVHVAEAAFRALRTLSLPDDSGLVRAGIALPDNELHRRLMQPALVALKRLHVAIFWVDGDGDVTVDSPWPIPA